MPLNSQEIVSKVFVVGLQKSLQLKGIAVAVASLDVHEIGHAVCNAAFQKAFRTLYNLQDCLKFFFCCVPVQHFFSPYSE